MHLVNNIDITHGLLGGIILGVSSSSFMYMTGKITGLSGIIEGVVSVKGEDWHIPYVFGLLSSGAALQLSQPNIFIEHRIESSALLLVAGVLTGFGARLSGGCTSGHGLCGLSRRSPRSLAAVLTFMTTGAIGAKFASQSSSLIPFESMVSGGSVVGAFAALSTIYFGLNAKPIGKKISEFLNGKGSSLSMHITSFLTSFVFGLGLGISGMCSSARVQRFLDFSGTAGWDPTLASVLGGGVTVTFVTFHWMHYSKTKAVLSPNANLSDTVKMGTCAPNMLMDWKLFLGAALFGIGWGMAGVCPGPALVNFGAAAAGPAGLGGILATTAGKFVPSLLIGMILKEITMG